jgi:anthranilate 1,2-dioxygenase small subunit
MLGQPYAVSERKGKRASFMVARIMRDGSTTLFATGRYCDVYVVVDGGAKLRECIVVCDSSRIDMLLTLPL